ncbi:MAG: DUF4199 domain-containing protein [Thermoanaerobaculia bacterium]
MKKTIITYGVIAGGIIALSMAVGYFVTGGDHMVGEAHEEQTGEGEDGALWADDETGGFDVEMSEWLGYLFMLVALSVIFLGVKKYRDHELGGVIKFGTAFLIGLGISVIASLIYTVAWEVSLSLTDYAFIEDYTQSVVSQKKAEGVSGAELDALIAEMEEMKVQYAKPVYRMGITFMEMFPVGLLVSLISAVLLRNSKLLPATA